MENNEKVRFIQEELDLNRQQAEALWEGADTLIDTNSVKRFLGFQVVFGYEPTNKELKKFQEMLKRIKSLKAQDIDGKSLRHLKLINNENK